MTTHALNDMKERPSSAIYVEMFVAFFANAKVVYQCKVSESITLVVDESLSCKYNELEGFVSDARESDDSDLSEVEATFVQHKTL